MVELANPSRAWGLQPILVRRWAASSSDRGSAWRASAWRGASRSGHQSSSSTRTALEVSIMRTSIADVIAARGGGSSADDGPGYPPHSPEIGKDKGRENRIRLAEETAEIASSCPCAKTRSARVRDDEGEGRADAKRLAKKGWRRRVTLRGCGRSRWREPEVEPTEAGAPSTDRRAGAAARKRTALVNIGSDGGRGDELVDILRPGELVEEIPDTNRDNLART